MGPCMGDGKSRHLYFRASFELLSSHKDRVRRSGLRADFRRHLLAEMRKRWTEGRAATFRSRIEVGAVLVFLADRVCAGVEAAFCVGPETAPRWSETATLPLLAWCGPARRRPCVAGTLNLRPSHATSAFTGIRR